MASAECILFLQHHSHETVWAILSQEPFVFSIKNPQEQAGEGAQVVKLLLSKLEAHQFKPQYRK
jgi:hypothetical protein